MTKQEWDNLKVRQVIFYGSKQASRIITDISGGNISVKAFGEDEITVHSIFHRNKFQIYPSHTLNCKCGWLSPEGVLYPCGFAGHARLGDTLCEMNGLPKDNRYLEQCKWIKLTTDIAGWYQWLPENALPTQAQIDTIFDWCTKNKARLPKFIDDQP